MADIRVLGEKFTLESGKIIAFGDEVIGEITEVPQVPQELYDELFSFLSESGLGGESTPEEKWNVVLSKTLEEKKAILTTGVDILSRIEESVKPNINDWNFPKGLIKAIPYLTTDEAVLDVFDETFFRNFMYSN